MSSPFTLRNRAATVVLGGLLTAASVTGAGGAVSAAPMLRAADCNNPDYVGKIVTTTRLSLERQVARQGYRNSGAIYVTSNTTRMPQGKARLVVRVQGSNRIVASRTEELERGRARISLPRDLRTRRTYEIVAMYLPNGCSFFRPGRSNVQFYTVMPGAGRG